MNEVIITAAKGAPTLDAIGKQTGNIVLKALMVKFLNSFLHFYNFARMDDEHRIEIVELILDEYAYFTLADLKFFFKQAKKGCFGDLYGRLDGTVIFSWLRKYHIQRREAWDSHQRQQQIHQTAYKSRQWQEYVQSEAFIQNHNRAQEGYRNLIEKLSTSEYGIRGEKITSNNKLKKIK